MSDLIFFIAPQMVFLQMYIFFYGMLQNVHCALKKKWPICPDDAFQSLGFPPCGQMQKRLLELGIEAEIIIIPCVRKKKIV